MSSAELKISKSLHLPAEAVTQTFAILAKRGAGKTYTALVLVEELLHAGHQVVVVDPVGVTWGLRSSADGKRAGLEIAILGGDHGDLPLEVTAGELVADLVVDDGVPAVLDLSGFRKGEQVRFMTDFAERLYHRSRSPLHLVLDEADMFAPQRPSPGHQRMLGAVEDLVRRGRARGLGITMVSQRSAVLNKDVLTQVEVLVAMRTTSPQDRAAVDEWVKVHGDQDRRRQLMSDLPGLPIGTAWIWSPGWLDLFRKVRIRKRLTFDSSATPGQRVRQPRRLADVDLEELKVRMSDAVERARNDDPKLLRRRIRELEAQQQATDVEATVAAAVADRDRTWRELVASRDELLADCRSRFERIRALLEGAASTPHRVPPAEPSESSPLSIPNGRAARPSKQLDKRAPAPTADAGGELTKAQAAILQALYWLRGERVTPAKVGFYAGYTDSSGHFNRALGQLRSRGLVSGWSITDAGRAIVADQVEAKPSGPDLREWLRPKLSLAQNALLDVLVAASGERLATERLAERAGYSAGSGHFNRALGKLRTLEAAEGYDRDGGVRAAEVFFE